MSDLGNKAVMAENIKRFLDKRGMTMKALSHAIDVPYTTVCAWCKGVYYPRIDKIEKMANLFGISKADLVERFDKESRTAMLEKVYEENRVLFMAAEEATPEEIKKAAEYLEFLKAQR